MWLYLCLQNFPSKYAIRHVSLKVTVMCSDSWPEIPTSPLHHDSEEQCMVVVSGAPQHVNLSAHLTSNEWLTPYLPPKYILKS